MTTTTSAQWTEHYLRTDDGPFIVLGAEVHNSSSSSLPAITESFATVHRLGANTVLAPSPGIYSSQRRAVSIPP